MSVQPHTEPQCCEPEEAAVDLEIQGRARDLGDGLTVRRLLPSPARKMVGPFIFVDEMGPVQFAPGQGIDVRPHPHIGLATVTYLFEGEILHRDSLGSEQPIRPGAVNWMVAGRGIVHSERTSSQMRSTGQRLHGLQLWIALPLAHEETEPSFRHHPADTIPTVEQSGTRLRIIAGSAYGVTSPASVLSAMFYVEAQLDAGAELTLPDEHEERAAYIVDGAVGCQGKRHAAGAMLVFHPGRSVRLVAESPVRMMLLGGAPLESPRHIDWNFVSSSKARIEQARDDWQQRRFPAIPGDDLEFIPLPPRP